MIRAATPIQGLEPARYRAPILVVGAERFALEHVEGTPKKPIYRLRISRPGLYEPEGKLFYYDGERHLEERRDKVRVALAWFLWIPMTPLMPLLGFLPDAAKQKLVHIGINPGRATRLSIGVEWLLLGVSMLAYAGSGGLFTPIGAVVGATSLFLATDIAYRVAADYDDKSPGVGGIIPATYDWIRGGARAWQGKDRLLLDDKTEELPTGVPRLNERPWIEAPTEKPTEKSDAPPKRDR